MCNNHTGDAYYTTSGFDSFGFLMRVELLTNQDLLPIAMGACTALPHSVQEPS